MHWGYSCNVSVISEGRLLWKMARGAGLRSVTDADFHAAQKDVSKGDTAVPMGAKTRLIGNKQSAAGMRFDPQQEAFLHTTWGLADDLSDRRQAWGQQQLQRQQQQQAAAKPPRRGQQQQKQQQQQQEQQEQQQEQELAEPMPTAEPTRRQPGRSCKRTFDGGLADAQQPGEDLEGGSGAQAPVE